MILLVTSSMMFYFNYCSKYLVLSQVYLWSLSLYVHMFIIIFVLFMFIVRPIFVEYFRSRTTVIFSRSFVISIDYMKLPRKVTLFSNCTYFLVMNHTWTFLEYRNHHLMIERNTLADNERQLTRNCPMS